MAMLVYQRVVATGLFLHEILNHCHNCGYVLTSQTSPRSQGASQSLATRREDVAFLQTIF